METERIIKQGKPIMRGTAQCKNFRGVLHYFIGKYTKLGNNELKSHYQGLLQQYNKFHPLIDTHMTLNPWKGKSGYNVNEYDNFFVVHEWRKHDEYSEPKEYSKKVDRLAVQLIINTLKKVKLNKRYRTPEFAEKWARINKININADGKVIYNEDGFNYSNISGCRKTYFHFYYPLKVCEHFGFIKHSKSGHITKLTNDLELPEEIK